MILHYFWINFMTFSGLGMTVQTSMDKKLIRFFEKV